MIIPSRGGKSQVYLTRPRLNKFDNNIRQIYNNSHKYAHREGLDYLEYFTKHTFHATAQPAPASLFFFYSSAFFVVLRHASR
jgi:hypothetical protein